MSPALVGETHTGGGGLEISVQFNYRLEVACPFWRVPISILEAEIVMGLL